MNAVTATTSTNRRNLCGALLLASLAPALPARASGPTPGRPSGAVRTAALTITDMAGRTVQLAAAPRRIVLLEARDIVSMAMLHPDPASLVVGWAAADRIDSGLLQARYARQIKVVGKQTPDTLSQEGLISLAPDLVVANLHMAPHGPDDLLIQRLMRLGIPVIFSDVSSNAAGGNAHDAVADLHRFIRMWGEVLGAAERATELGRFIDDRLARVQARLAGAAPVTTYLELQSTTDDCCWAAGRQVWGELLALAGGQTLPGITAPWFQKLPIETLLSTPHAVYIASGGGWAVGGRPGIGPGLDTAAGREGLARLTRRTGFAELASVRQRRVHGIWTGLIAVPPLNILFVELAAKWLHPDRCADLDPAATLADLNARFPGEPIPGPLWVSLKE